MLIADERRLAAYKVLGHEVIPVTVIDIDALVRGELAENFHRKDFTPTESVAIWDAVEPIEREATKERQIRVSVCETFAN